MASWQIKKNHGRQGRRARSCWNRPEPLRNQKFALHVVQRPQGLPYSLGHLLCPFKKQAAIQTFLRHFLIFTKQKGQTDSGKCSLLTKTELSSHHLCLHTTDQSYAQDFANLQPFICRETSWSYTQQYVWWRISTCNAKCCETSWREMLPVLPDLETLYTEKNPRTQNNGGGFKSS